MQKLLNVSECADLLHISKHKLYRLTAARQIPTVRIGSKCLFNPECLAEWVREHSIEPGVNHE
ncbi:MAG: helix-turn-helix domain-containing protein [Planctomycetes bacterium]|nr:helix-turn-helix domain-containing protein [Planctomycetota bacterium]